MDKIQNNNPANDPALKPIKNHSVFKPNYSLLTTQLFGLIQPHMAAEVVPDDSDVQFRTGTDIDTYTLKAPMMVPVQAHKDHFFVPLRAILPRNAELIVTNPRTGDDVVAADVNCVVDFSGNWTMSNAKFGAQNLAVVLGNGQSTPATKQSNYIAQAFGYSLWYYSVCAQLFSVGSLARNLGYSIDPINWPQDLTDNHELTFDEFFERIFAWVNTQIDTFEVQVAQMTASNNGAGSQNPAFTNRTLYVHMADIDNFHTYGNHISFRRLLQILLQGHVFLKQVNVYSTSLKSGISDNTVVTIPMDETGLNCSVDSYGHPAIGMNLGLERPLINLDRLIAYQIACAQFYTDDAVDYVYNSQLWHDNMDALANQFFENQGQSYGQFLVNGVSHKYDTVSGKVLHNMIMSALSYVAITPSSLVDDTYFQSLPYPSSALASLGYLFNLFGYQRSLRYRDYLVGAKTQPLAVDSTGATGVAVNANIVDVVDVTKGIMMQKFLNQVNRVGRSLKNYTKGIFGTTPMEDPREVKFLSAIQWQLGAEETTNTGSDQLSNPKSITSHLRNDSSRFVFTFGTGEYGILIGMTYFDMPRCYGYAFDRPLLHVDRFDMFNPYLQHIGDQDVKGIEVDVNQSSTFGYQGRYMEYKQRLDRAAGGFLNNQLPGYALVANPVLMRQPWDTKCEISPDFIRSRPVEFDQFYLSLVGVTMANYFHFIIRHDNQITMNRPMEAAPSIL